MIVARHYLVVNNVDYLMKYENVSWMSHSLALNRLGEKKNIQLFTVCFRPGFAGLIILVIHVLLSIVQS